MTKRNTPMPIPFDARERDLIRREFGIHFSQPSYLADGILLRTWRAGPEKDKPKIPPAVRSMLARGLVEIRPGTYGWRAFFTEAGIAGVKALLADGRRMDAKTYAHLREELGLTASGATAADDQADLAHNERET